MKKPPCQVFSLTRIDANYKVENRTIRTRINMNKKTRRKILGLFTF